MNERFPEQIAGHRLRREIIATVMTNEFVNRLGPTFAFRVSEELSTSIADLMRAFVVSTELFNMPRVWGEIEALDNQVDASKQLELLILVRGLVERCTHWLTRTRRAADKIEDLLTYYCEDMKTLRMNLEHTLAPVNLESLVSRSQYFIDAGVPETLARRCADVVPLSSSLDIIEVAKNAKMDVNLATAVYFQLGVVLELQWLRDQIAHLPVATRWHALAKSRLRSDLHNQQRKLTAELLGSIEPSEAEEMVETWSKQAEQHMRVYQRLMSEIKAAGATDFAMLSVAVTEVHDLLQTSEAMS